MPNQLTLEENFALKLNLLDSVDFSCFQQTTSLGSIVKEIMIDNYQLILTRKHWSEINRLKLFFDVVDYGNIDDFIMHAIHRKQSNKSL